ncbi:MAG: DNA-protecting protein DprA [Candidatus Omnitrophica bacterium]|nr:DNA-protecting protein DprA [Candidatus Omnitrophota bacterium]
MNELDALLILNAVAGIGNSTIRKLLEYYGGALKVLSLTEEQLTADQAVSSMLAAAIVQFPKDEFLSSERSLVARQHARVLTFQDKDYPSRLRDIADAPVVVYVRGQLSVELAPAIAVVGSRRASLYGMAVAEQFAGRLAELGITVVSGMAKGIDAAAHRGALRAGGATVAVLGCGLNTIYPPENEKLFTEIAAGGAVISEFPMTMPPIAHNFPRRNRIISGLSLGVIVVEAAQKSGALITADFALEQGREVYAVPGNVNSMTSQGVHNLIKQGAKLVTSVEDILEDLSPHLRAVTGEPRKDKDALAVDDKGLAALTQSERLIYDSISDRPVHIDDLADRCGTDVLRMTVALSRLELKHLIKQLPGKLFVR